MVSLLFVFTAFVISNIGHIRPQRTILAFVSGIFFILSGNQRARLSKKSVSVLKSEKMSSESLLQKSLLVFGAQKQSKTHRTHILLWKKCLLRAFLVTVYFHIFQLLCCCKAAWETNVSAKLSENLRTNKHFLRIQNTSRSVCSCLESNQATSNSPRLLSGHFFFLPPR